MGIIYRVISGLSIRIRRGIWKYFERLLQGLYMDMKGCIWKSRKDRWAL